MLALSEILGIMSDQLMDGEMQQRWDAEHVVDLQLRLNDAHNGDAIEIGIDDAALLLDGQEPLGFRRDLDLLGVGLRLGELADVAQPELVAALLSAQRDDLGQGLGLTVAVAVTITAI